jgi:hypothetical protein
MNMAFRLITASASLASAFCLAGTAQAYTQCQANVEKIWAGDGGYLWIHLTNGGAPVITANDPNREAVLAMARLRLQAPVRLWSATRPMASIAQPTADRISSACIFCDRDVVMIVQRILFAVLFGAIPQASMASEAAAGHVSAVSPLRSNIVFFDHSGERTSTPACSTFPKRWSIDVSTPGGQAAFSLWLSAHAQNRPIRVVGMGSCTDWNDTEAANYIVSTD